MKRLLTFVCATGISLAAFSSCSNDPTVKTTNGSNGGNLNFIQIDRVGRPGIKELYLAYSQHTAFVNSTPSGDIATYGPMIASFVTGTAGRSSAIAAYVSALLTPDALVANLYGTAPSSYLGWETQATSTGLGQIPSGAGCAGGSTTVGGFGGRSLSDDVVSTMLSLSYGSLATTTTLTNATPNVTASPAPDDGKEQNGQNGTRNLACQFVPYSASSKGITSLQFPYLGAPH
jgi:hypothetical protein